MPGPYNPCNPATLQLCKYRLFTFYKIPVTIETFIYIKRSGLSMQRTELASLYKATPADGTKVTVSGEASVGVAKAF